MSGRAIDIHRCEPRLVMPGLINDHRGRWTSSERSWRIWTPWTDGAGWRRKRQAGITVAQITSGRDAISIASLEKQRRTSEARRLHNSVGISGWMHILGTRCGGKLSTGCLCLLQKLQALSDRRIPGVQLCSSSVGIDSVGNLVVAALVQTSEIKPNFGDVWVNANSP